jgi:glycosyltransferase involved in cell wall biosynthesis
MADFEVVAVNDRSEDETAAILFQWASRDSRVRVLDPNGSAPSCAGAPATGIVAALQAATAAARAPLLARMDADDVAEPDRFELQRNFLAARRDLAACGTAVRLFPRSEVRQGYERYECWLNGRTDREELWHDLFVECPIAHPTLMIRRSVLEALGGYRDAGWPEDYDLVLRMYAAGMRAENLPATLLRWRVRGDRHSLVSGRYSAEAFRRCKVHFLKEVFLPPDRPVVVWGAGKVGKPLARELLRQGIPVEAFRLFAREHPYVLAAVGSPGAREEIRGTLDAMNCHEIDDYRVCA